MDCKITNHLSHNFKLNIDKLPTAKTDKFPTFLVVLGALLSVTLIFLGLADWLFAHDSSLFKSLEHSHETGLLPLWLFDVILCLMGFVILAVLIVKKIQYKKIALSKNNVKIIQRIIGKGKIQIVEPLKNYVGVRYRIEFMQYGILTKNRYIVELLHKDAQKTIPLYISFSDKDFRSIAKKYALALKKTLITLTPENVMPIEAKNLNKPLVQLLKENIVQDTYDRYEKLPKTLCFLKKDDKVILKIKKVLTDIYNFIEAMAVLVLFLLIMAFYPMLANIFGTPLMMGWLTLMVLGLIWVFLAFTSKEKVVIKQHKIIHIKKCMGFSRKSSELLKKDIEAIIVAYSPQTNRHYVALYTDTKVMVVGKKLKLEELQWIAKFLIHVTAQ